MRSRYTDVVQKKHIVIYGIVIFSLVIAALQLLYINVVQRDDLISYSRKKIERSITLYPKRGNLYDRNGELIATSVQEYELWIDPVRLLDEEANQLAAQLITLDSLLHRCQDLRSFLEKRKEQGRRFVRVYARLSASGKHNCESGGSNAYLDIDQATQVESLNLPGVRLNPVYRRYYPFKEIFAQAAGYMNSRQAQDGMELMLDEHLKGTQGTSWILLDGKGRAIDATSLEEPVNHGKDITLSFDYRLQLYAYQALEQAVRKNRAMRGSVVVLNPQTGEMLAMVNYPSFNPNSWTQAQVTKNYNYAIRDLLEFGSVLKPFTMVALLNKQVIRDHERVDVSKGSITIGDRVFTDIKRRGKLTVPEIITYSSNVGIIELTKRLKPSMLYQEFVRLTLADAVRTDVPLLKALPLNLQSLEQGTNVLKSSIAHGYSYSLSALKLAQLYSIFANRGVEVPLRFIKDPVTVTTQSIVRSRPEIIDAVNKMLVSVVREGTGKKAQVLPYQAAGKTGTARIFDAKLGSYSEEKYIASFAGFAPNPNPSLLCVVVMYQPQGNSYYASEVAAPLFSKITRYALRLYGIAPSRSVL